MRHRQREARPVPERVLRQSYSGKGSEELYAESGGDGDNAWAEEVGQVRWQESCGLGEASGGEDEAEEERFVQGELLIGG